MKKMLLCLSAIALTSAANAQWTGTNPLTTPSAVGIGTSPTLNYIPLQVRADESLFGGSGIVASFERFSPNPLSTGKLNITVSDFGDSYNAGDILMDAQGNADIALRTQGGSGGILVLKRNGTVGIGTGTPTTDAAVKLHIKSYGADPQNAQILIESSETQAVRFARSGINTWIMGRRASDNAFSITDSYFFDGNTEKFVLNGSGFLGLGAQTPSEKLDILNGNLKLTNGTFLPYGNDTRVLFQSHNTSASGSPVQFEMLHQSSGVELANRRGYLTMRADDGNLNLLSSQKVLMYTGGVQRMVVDPTGRVGIGQTAPASTLDVNGTLRLSVAGAQAGFVLTATNANGDATWQALPTPATQWSVNGADVYRSTGNVGIGTNTPSARFQIVDGSTQMSLMSTGVSSGMYGTQYYAGINFEGGDKITVGKTFNPNTYGSHFAIKNETRANSALIALAYDKVYIGGSSAGVNAVSFSNDGVVNIGSGTIPAGKGYMLGVRGKIICEEVKVALHADWPWADYVFADDYKLTSLDSLESYIKENKHLPNISSAKEIKEEGINLGQMQNKHMEKIEELTLYIIELNKKLSEQQQLNTTASNLQAQQAKQIEQLTSVLMEVSKKVAEQAQSK